jgi:hypothetical protein
LSNDLRQNLDSVLNRATWLKRAEKKFLASSSALSDYSLGLGEVIGEFLLDLRLENSLLIRRDFLLFSTKTIGSELVWDGVCLPS